MAELNFKQITDRLNAEFTGDTRKLVFWYDDHADFAEDIDTLQLENAKLLKLTPGSQFATKYFLERQDKTTNYLIYAPFPKPDVRENHLEDTMLYSKRFFADRASLLSVDLGIDQKYKQVIEKHIKFFASKERTQRFYDLEIENFNEENILIGLMSAVCRTRTCSFDEVVRVLLTEKANFAEGEKEAGPCCGDLQDNAFLAEMDKYDLLPAFWKFCEQQFGYSDSKPTLEKLVVTMFVTYAGKYIQKELPKSWQTFVSYKPGNSIAFLDSLMNNYLYRDSYDALAAHVAAGLNIETALQDYAPETLVECDSFVQIDAILLRWLVKRLEAEDTGAQLAGHAIPEICEMRTKMHFGSRFASAYALLASAHSLILAAHYNCPDTFKEIMQAVCTEQDCLIDAQYRRFYANYDKLENSAPFEQLRDLVETYLLKRVPWQTAPQMERGAA
jgi:hypothetical protein